EADGRLPAEELARARHVGPRHGRVARRGRLALDRQLASGRALDVSDEVAHARALAAAQVREGELAGPHALGRGREPARDVVDVSEIALDRAVAVEGHRAAGERGL